LFKFSCKNTEGYAVTSADWNPINKDLLAVSYGDLDIDSTREGYLMFWTLKNPSFPEKIIVCPTRITTCKFSNDNPNLIACGTYDGVVAIYDIRKKDSKPVAENREVLDKHSDAVWEIQWISKGKGNDKGESLVSISADGRITEWSMKKGLEFTDLMLLRRIPQSNKKDSS
jgi:WD40 repeat protein